MLLFLTKHSACETHTSRQYSTLPMTSNAVITGIKINGIWATINVKTKIRWRYGVMGDYMIEDKRKAPVEKKNNNNKRKENETEVIYRKRGNMHEKINFNEFDN